jgi:hypothetical protein
MQSRNPNNVIQVIMPFVTPAHLLAEVWVLECVLDGSLFG